MPGWNESAWFAMLLGAALKSTVVLGVAWLLAWALRRRSAAARHLVWTAAAAALLALPVLSVTLPALRVRTDAFATLAPTITFTYQDQSTAANLQTVWALINTAIDGRAACYVAYYRPGNQLYLYPDNGDGTQATNIVLAGNNTIGNSQCTISAQGANVQTTGNTLMLSLPITFKPAFAGFRGVWMAAYTLGGAVSPWQALGAWNVP